MNVLRSLWASVEGDPVWMRKVHGWLTILWFAAAFPVMYLWSENITFLVFVSVYAVVTGHWSSYQACKVEVKQDEDDGDLSPRIVEQIERAVARGYSRGGRGRPDPANEEEA